MHYSGSPGPSKGQTSTWEFPKIWGVPYFGALELGSYYLRSYIRVPDFRKPPHELACGPEGLGSYQVSGLGYSECEVVFPGQRSHGKLSNQCAEQALSRANG